MDINIKAAGVGTVSNSSLTYYLALLVEAGHRFTIEDYPIGAPHDDDVYWRIVVYKHTGAIGIGEADSLYQALKQVWLIVMDQTSEHPEKKKGVNDE